MPPPPFLSHHEVDHLGKCSNFKGVPDAPFKFAIFRIRPVRDSSQQQRGERDAMNCIEESSTDDMIWYRG